MKEKENRCTRGPYKQGLCNQNSKKQPGEWTVAQTKTMATWYKQAGDLTSPTKKQLLFTRYHDTMMCVDTAVPVATAMAPLPHPLIAPISYMTRSKNER